MSITEDQLHFWLASYLWPLIRISALVGAAPIFSSRQLPVRIRIGIAVILTLWTVPLLPPMPVVDMISSEAMLIAMQQVLIGVSMGFVLQMVFAALVFGSQALAFSMGLGFASMLDPQNGVQVPVVSQLYLILGTLLFLLFNVHLQVISLVVDSFVMLPVATQGLGREGLEELVAWGSRMFAGGLLISMPAITALLLLNLGMGIIGRAAPQLNIFAVGFPVAILLGIVIMWITLPDIVAFFGELLNEGVYLITKLLQTSG